MNVDTMPKPNKKLLCVGNTTVDTDIKCKQISEAHNIPYKGMAKDFLLDGCYHTSFGDIDYSTMLALCGEADEVIFLNQDETVINNEIFKNTLHPTYTVPAAESLIVGCSHTAGIGHVSQETVYTTLVSEQLGIRPVVKAFPGKGNSVIEDTLSNFKLKDSTVIVQFTDIFRIRYYDSSTQSIIHKLGKDYSRNEIEMFTDDRMMYEFKQLVKRVVLRLRDANCKFLFFQLMSNHKHSDELCLFLSSIEEYCWTPDIDLDKATDNLHHGIKSHQRIAARIVDKWNQLYA